MSCFPDDALIRRVFSFELAGTSACTSKAGGDVHAQIADARHMVEHALSKGGHHGGGHVTFSGDMRSELDDLKKKNAEMTEMLNAIMKKVSALELRSGSAPSSVAATPTSPAGKTVPVLAKTDVN